jgi:Tol biopolymer transport system component
MDPDGGNPTQLTQGDWNDCSPIFTPSGKHIVFASDRGLNDVKKRNYDIWMITKDGSSETQLTRNGSYDFSPAVSSDGRFLYFFSNRGAQKPGQESLQIFRLDLPK